MPADGDGGVAWVWLIGRVAKEFGVLPSVAEREIMDDPDGRAIELLGMFAYAQLKGIAESAKDEESLRPYAKSKLMKQVKANIMYFEHKAAHTARGVFSETCAGCRKAREAGEI